MSLKIEPRRSISWQMLYLTPPLAVLLTVLTGFFLFLLMGYPPFKALMSFFISPLTSFYGLSELCVKAAPLIMIAVGLAIGFRANVWNIGAEGQLTMGASPAVRSALAIWGEAGGWILPDDAGRGLPGRHGLCGDPGLPQGPVRRQRDPDQPDADLRRDAVPQHHGLRPAARTPRATASRSRACSPRPRSCRSSSRAHACISVRCWRSRSRSARGC